MLDADAVLIVGDDTDLLVLAVHFIEEMSPPRNMFMFRQSSNTYVDLKCVVTSIPKQIRVHILAIHSLSGCDTVSQLFGVGKDRLYKWLSKNPDKANELNAFLRCPYDKNSIKKSGFNIIAALYSLKNEKFEDLRPL